MHFLGEGIGISERLCYTLLMKMEEEPQGNANNPVTATA